VTTIGALAAVLALAGCTADQAAPAPAPAATLATPSVTPTGEPAAPEPTATPLAPQPAGPALPPATASPQDVLTGLVTPWSLAFLPGGAVLVTLRDTGQVLLLAVDGVAPLTGPGADALATGTVHGGEGGLLGVAVHPSEPEVFLYRTAVGGNEVVRATLDPVARTLGPLQLVLGGIPAARTHNGGRLAIGPDGFLYVTTGDAGSPSSAQDPASLAGKILRLALDGTAAPGNPEGGAVWSLGHRNVQGIGWTADGRMLAAEFGQNTWDELNLVVPGGNYGWPVVEGVGSRAGYLDPLRVWATDDASPSGLAVSASGVHLAGLRGERLWTVPLTADGATGEPYASLDLGRLRDVVSGPDGALWVLTQNTDGRGSPRAGDDRLVRLTPP